MSDPDYSPISDPTTKKGKKGRRKSTASSSKKPSSGGGTIEWTKDMRIVIFVTHRCWDITDRNRIGILNILFKDHLRDSCGIPHGLSTTPNSVSRVGTAYRQHRDPRYAHRYEGIVGGKNYDQEDNIRAWWDRITDAADACGLGEPLKTLDDVFKEEEEELGEERDRKGEVSAWADTSLKSSKEDSDVKDTASGQTERGDKVVEESSGGKTHAITDEEWKELQAYKASKASCGGHSLSDKQRHEYQALRSWAAGMPRVKDERESG